MGEASVSTLHQYSFAENPIQQALRAAVDGQDAPIQRIAQAVKQPVGTVKGWWYGERRPSGENLIALMAAYPQVFEAVIAMVGSSARYSIDPAFLGRVLAGVE